MFSYGGTNVSVVFSPSAFFFSEIGIIELLYNNESGLSSKMGCSS